MRTEKTRLANIEKKKRKKRGETTATHRQRREIRDFWRNVDLNSVSLLKRTADAGHDQDCTVYRVMFTVEYYDLR